MKFKNHYWTFVYNVSITNDSANKRHKLPPGIYKFIIYTIKSIRGRHSSTFQGVFYVGNMNITFGKKF